MDELEPSTMGDIVAVCLSHLCYCYKIPQAKQLRKCSSLGSKLKARSRGLVWSVWSKLLPSPQRVTEGHMSCHEAALMTQSPPFGLRVCQS